MKILHGIDLTNITRKEFKEEGLIKKILHPYEYEIYLTLDKEQQTKYVAKHWAIKEAIFKAYNHKYGMNKVLIEKKDQQLFSIVDDISFTISISYEDQYVIASVVAMVD